MIIVITDNSTSRIDGLNIQQFKQLRRHLSYLPDANYHSFFGPKRVYLLDKKGNFPTGLYKRVIAWLKHHKLPHELKDVRKCPNSLLGRFTPSLQVTPYPHQQNAATAILERYRGIITAPTGFGKSIIIALAISRIKVPTLVVVPTLELKRQLTETLKSIFPNENVGIVGNTIAIENVDALDVDCESVGYGMVIIDEFHHSAAKTYRKLNEKCWNNVYYRLGLSATPFRSKDQENILLEGVIADVIYEVPYSEAVDNNYIVPLEAYYVELPTIPIDEDATWPQVYSKLVVNNSNRNKTISDLMGRLHRSKTPTLCLVKEIAHGNSIQKLSGSAFANGVSDDCAFLIDAFNQKKLTTLIGTVGVLGEGVDTRPAEYIIIAGLGKARTQFMQSCGRGFRTHVGKDTCKVIIFKDPSHKFTLRHFKEQCKILEQEYGVKPIKLEI